MLDRPQPLGQSIEGHQLDPVRELLAQPREVADGDVAGLEAEANLSVRKHARDGLDEVARGLVALERRVHLLGDLLAVAKVGRKHAQIGPNHRQPVAPGEAGQVADVHELGDGHHVDLRVRQERGQVLGVVGHVCSSSRSRSSASR